MKIIDVLNSLWAIVPEKLLEICEIYGTHLRGDKIDVAAIEARIGKPLKNDQQNYSVDGGVAVIPIDGVLSKKMNLFSMISGGTSTQMMAKTFQDAMDNPEVHSIVLAVDSPGGTVDGTQSFADAVYQNRDKKRIVTLADGMMASAAYWIGSAAHEIYISSDTDLIGSIGVVATHVDYSEQDRARGVKVTEITAGKYKRMASSHAPLTESGRQSIQDQIDHVYSVFVDNVARNRGVSSDDVLNRMADGKVFLGKKAKDAGLVDGVSTMDALVSRLNREYSNGQQRAVAQILNERIKSYA